MGSAMKRHILGMLLATATVLAGACAEAKEWTKVRIATEGAYAPWNFTEASGKLNGFDIQIRPLANKNVGSYARAIHISPLYPGQRS